MTKSDVVMPFGKHKGEFVSEVPANYLRWFLENVAGQEAVKVAIRERLNGPKGLLPEVAQSDLSEDFVMPVGKWKGVRVSEMSIETLAALANSYNGSNKPESVALTRRLRACLDAKRKGELPSKAQVAGPNDGFIYEGVGFRSMVGVRPLTPWRDGWGVPDTDSEPPFDVERKNHPASM